MAEDAKEPAVTDGDKKKKTERRQGKFTGANEKTGQCKWGAGWTTEGMKRFNEFFNLVSEDRKWRQNCCNFVKQQRRLQLVMMVQQWMGKEAELQNCQQTWNHQWMQYGTSRKYRGRN